LGSRSGHLGFQSGFSGFQPLHLGVGAARTLLTRANKGSKITVDRMVTELGYYWRGVSYTYPLGEDYATYLCETQRKRLMSEGL